MPSTGMPRPKIPGSAWWAPASYTLRGPPERMIPFGERRRTSSAEMEAGTISERTRHSRTRRAMSWAYWAPKSTTRTVSKSDMGSGPLAHSLLALQVLALAGDGRGDDDLRLLELLDRGVATGGGRERQGPEEVHRAVVDRGRAEQDLLEGPLGAGGHPDTSGQGGMEACHAPVVATTGSLYRPGEGRTDHDRIGPAGDGLGDVAPGAHPAVGDDLHVAAGLVEVAHPGRRNVRDGRRLGHPDP